LRHIAYTDTNSRCSGKPRVVSGRSSNLRRVGGFNFRSRVVIFPPFSYFVARRSLAVAFRHQSVLVARATTVITREPRSTPRCSRPPVCPSAQRSPSLLTVRLFAFVTLVAADQCIIHRALLVNIDNNSFDQPPLSNADAAVLPTVDNGTFWACV